MRIGEGMFGPHCCGSYEKNRRRLFLRLRFREDTR